MGVLLHVRVRADQHEGAWLSEGNGLQRGANVARQNDVTSDESHVGAFSHSSGNSCRLQVRPQRRNYDIDL
jgi:hypothetical protein